MRKRISAICWTIVVAPLVLNAQVKAHSTSTFTSSIDGVIAQVADGGSWRTIINLVNVDTSVGAYVIKFYTDNGSPMTLQTTGGNSSTIAGRFR